MVLDRGSNGNRPLATPPSIGSSSQLLILHPLLSATAPYTTDPVNTSFPNHFLVPQPYPGFNQVQYCTQFLPSSHPTGYLSNSQTHQQYTLPPPFAYPTRPLANMQSSMYARHQSPYTAYVLANIQPPALSAPTQSFPYTIPVLGLPPFCNPAGFLRNHLSHPTIAHQYPNPTNIIGINQPVYTGTEQMTHPTDAFLNNPSVMSTHSYPVNRGPFMRLMHPPLGFMPVLGSNPLSSGDYHGATNEICYMQHPFSSEDPSMSDHTVATHSSQATESVNSTRPIINDLENDNEEESPLIASTAAERPHGKMPMLADEYITVRKSSETEKSRTRSGSEDAPAETLLVNEKKPDAISLTVEKQGEDLSKPNVFAGLGSNKETVDVVAAVGADVPDGEAEDGEPAVKKKKLSLSLAEEEIKADFLAFTGSMPPQEPRKREMDVEIQLGGIFPGSSLGAILTDEAGDSEDP